MRSGVFVHAKSFSRVKILITRFDCIKILCFSDDDDDDDVVVLRSAI